MVRGQCRSQSWTTELGLAYVDRASEEVYAERYDPACIVLRFAITGAEPRRSLEQSDRTTNPDFGAFQTA
jgi:hypothetical protein